VPCKIALSGLVCFRFLRLPLPAYPLFADVSGNFKASPVRDSKTLNAQTIQGGCFNRLLTGRVGALQVSNGERVRHGRLTREKEKKWT